MTQQEVNKLLALMKANYSYAFKTMSQQDKYLLLNTWTFALQDLNADVVMIAVMQLISVSKWLPIKDHIGCHTLRKTFGYHYYKMTQDVVSLQRILCHSSRRETLIYIGVIQEEIDESLMKFNLTRRR